jgi:hypothetical protein
VSSEFLERGAAGAASLRDDPLTEAHVRRRGVWRGRGRGGGGGRLLEHLKELKKLGLSDVRGLERLTNVPEEIELGSGRYESRFVAIVASKRDGLDLLGWARVAALRATEDQIVRDVVIAAPVFSARTRRAAARASKSGPTLLMVAVPGLAASSEEVFDTSALSATNRQLPLDGSSSVLDRVVRVIEGAVAVTSSGGVRPTGGDYVVYLRGERVGTISREGEGAAVTMLVPDRHHIHVTDGNFARWGPDLHEMIVQLARDPRLLESQAALRAQAFDDAAAEVGARITARWVPWSADGSTPLDWVGVDASGRPVLGACESSVGLADIPRLIAGLHVLEEERELWAPGAEGPARLVLACDQVDSEARSLLALALEEIEIPEADGQQEEDQEPRVRRGRRRPRRRRRGRAEEAEREEAPTPRVGTEAAGTEPMPLPPEEGEEEEPIAVEADSDEGPEESALERDESRRSSRGRRSRSRRGRPDRDRDRAIRAEEGDTRGPVDSAEDAPRPDSDEAEEGLASAEVPEEGEEVEIEIEAALAEAEEPAEDAPEAVEAEPVRRRRARAAIIVRDDPDCIMAALVLARERRSVVSFRICRQEGLMDFFRGPATDISENTDVLLVGFTCYPHPMETINTAELFRGRLQWLDHHKWAIEDVERLRQTIGDDAVLIPEDASSPLAVVLPMAERRSRFTDKLVELSGRRLSESEMEKWGYRVIGLVRKMANSPGEYRAEISTLLSGKPSELPKVESVYQDEVAWLEENDPRVIYFGEYQIAVVRVPKNLDPGEVGRRVRLSTGARLSLSSCEGDDILLLGCNEEKRPINVVGLADEVGSKVAWARAKAGGDRVGRLEVEGLEAHPERIDVLIGEIVRNRSILYG